MHPARRERESRDAPAAAAVRREGRGRRVPRAGRRAARRPPSARSARSTPRSARARSRARCSPGSQPGQRAAARRARARDHLRPDGRHQHGARRDADARRLRHVRRAERCSAATCPMPSTGTSPRRCRWRSRARSRWSAWCSSARSIRFLYGRPLETLLATCGVSLLLIQTVRTIFGAQNVEVANPSWLSGGIAGAAATWCCRGTASRSSPSRWRSWRLRVGRAQPHAPRPVRARGHAEPRDGGAAWASRTSRVDTWPSASASGSRGWAASRSRRSATSARTSGRRYIVDSFMVVVLGGVGQARRHGRRLASAWASSTSSSSRSPARCSRKIVGAGADHPVHPDAGRRACSPSRAARWRPDP